MLYFGIVGHLGIKCCHCELRLTILYMFELSKYLFIFRNMLMSINYAHREDRFGAMASFIPPRSHSNLPNEVMLVRSANATFNGHNIDYHWNFIPHHLQACWGFTFLLRSNALKIWFSTLAIEFGVSLEWATRWFGCERDKMDEIAAIFANSHKLSWSFLNHNKGHEH